MIISFAGQSVKLLPEKAIWIETLRLLCIADLHFEKDSFYVAHATFLPPYGSLETLQKLQKLVHDLNPAIVIAAGDSFHDKNAVMRMKPEIMKGLNQIIARVSQWHWLLGNHDPTIAPLIHGLRSKDLSLGGIIFRHQTTGGSDPEVSGHYHPKIRYIIRGHILSAPCFVKHRNRLFLPSFGQYTGGLDVNDTDFLQIIPREERKIFVVHGYEIIPQ